ncbi:MAG: hypothetical protein IPM92_02505 [Saprospiraceae bacterium]|nr:hypothetical protein [Saprospiraceae bacterium]
MKKYLNYILLFGFLQLGLNLGRTQVNVQVGYGLSFLNPKVNDAIIHDYLTENDWLVKKDIQLNMLHGIDLGLKHTWSAIAMGIVWKNRGGKLNFEGLHPVTGSLNKQELFYSLNTYSLFLETNGRFIGLGATLDWNDFGIKQRYTGLDSKINIISEANWGHRFYLNLNFPAGNSAQICLQFSYHLPYGEFDLNPLANSILTNNSKLYSKDKWNQFGITLLINNGP